MTKKINQMAVRYRSLADGDGIAFKWESSLDKILTAGNYAVEIDHYGADVGLPIEGCGTEHSVVGTLVVTDSGAVENKQGDRVIGQVITFTLRESKETSIYTRTYAGGEWGEWCSLARTGMYDEIANADALYSTVTTLASTTKELEKNLQASIINYNEWKGSDTELSLPNVLADDELVKMVKSGTILTFKNTSTTWKRFQYTAASTAAADVKSYSNWKELSGATYSIKQAVDAGKVQISTTGENGGVKDILNIAAATTERAGVMSAADKNNLDDNVAALAAEVARAQSAEKAAIEQGRKLALRDLFVAAGALYNDTGADITRTAPWGESVTHKDGHYYLNGLGDITEKEMMNIYNESNNYILSENIACFFFQSKIRTNLCKKGTGWNVGFSTTTAKLTFYNSLIEIAVVANPSWTSDDVYCFQAGDVSTMFDFCMSLKRVMGVINVTASTSGLKSAFSRCPALLSVKIKGLNQNVILKDSPLVEKDCIMYMIENANVSTAITITLHADAYSRLANDTDIVAALEAQPLVTLVSA